MIPTDVKAGVWQHYRGEHYLVLGLAQHTETGELLVCYVPLYTQDDNGVPLTGPRLRVRPAEEFFGDVLVLLPDGVNSPHAVPRYRYVGAEMPGDGQHSPAKTAPEAVEALSPEEEATLRQNVAYHLRHLREHPELWGKRHECPVCTTTPALLAALDAERASWREAEEMAANTTVPPTEPRKARKSMRAPEELRALQERLRKRIQETHDLRGGRTIEELIKEANRRARYTHH